MAKKREITYYTSSIKIVVNTSSYTRFYMIHLKTILMSSVKKTQTPEE